MSDVEIDPISEYLDLVYAPIEIGEEDDIKRAARVMRTQMDVRIQEAVSQLEEIGRPHGAAVKEVVAKLKNPDTARRQVLREAKIAIKRSKYSEDLKRAATWRLDAAGIWLLGIPSLSLIIRLLIAHEVSRYPITSLDFAASCFIVALACTLTCCRTIALVKPAVSYFGNCIFCLLYASFTSNHTNDIILEALSDSLYSAAAVSLGYGIIAYVSAKSKRKLVKS